MGSNPFLVDTNWLSNNLASPNVSIVDASWYLPTMLIDGVPRDGRKEFENQHIPGAVFFDIDDITEPGSSLPHTLASPQVFERKVGALGLSESDTIVVYDGMGLFSAPRIWWNFRVMGAKNVFILDGGLPQWIKEGRELETGTAARTPKPFKADFNNSSTVDLEAMKRIVANGTTQVTDARPADRFAGSAPEPRPGVRAGHMPGAYSIPFSLLANDGKLLSANELVSVFEAAGVDLDNPIATTCGSGVTAAALILALETVGHEHHVLYDGSWAEWGSNEKTKVVTD